MNSSDLPAEPDHARDENEGGKVTPQSPVAIADSSSVEPPDSAGGGDPPTDYDPEREVDEDIKAITVAYQAWDGADEEATAADSRSHKACRIALGEIFARSAPTDEDPEKKQILIERVKEVSDSSRYRPADHDAAELHLTLQFGLKGRRGAKSNWKTAIKAAEIELQQGKIADRSVEAFSKWFAEEGMRGARKVLDHVSGKADQAQAAIDGMQGPRFAVPDVWTCDEETAPGRALLLIQFLERGKHESPVAQALGILRDETITKAAAAAILRKEKDIDKANQVMAQQEMENRDIDAFSADLLIPKARRKHFGGRTHYTDEDERNEYERERKLEQQHVRKKRGKFKVKLPHELKQPRVGKVKLPLKPSANPDLEKGAGTKPALGSAGVELSQLDRQSDDGFDAEAYFAERLGDPD